MLYIYPTKPRPWLLTLLLWPALFLQTLWLHPTNGVKYAAHWANRALTKDSNLALA